MSMFHELMMKKKGMPSRYQEVEYIESTGTQYINTGVVGNSDTGLYVDVQWLNSNDTISIGSRATASGNSRFYIGNTSAGFYCGWNSLLATRPATNLDRNVISLNFLNNKKGYFNDTLLGTITEELYVQTSNIFLFGISIENNSTISYKSSIKLYSAQISQDNRLVRNYIPVYDTETQKYGMWESVQGKFYGNDGTGDFKGSIVGYTVVGSPTITDGVVSGFSSANYLRLPSFNPSNNFEMVFKFKFATSSTRNPIIGVNSGGIIRLLTFTNDKLLCSLGTSSANFSIMEIYGTDVLQTDTYYWIKFKFTGEEYIVEYSIDGINYIQQIYKKTSTLINSGNSFVITIGRSGTQGYALSGSIDLNETYIKQNNKLWFNGQQA